MTKNQAIFTIYIAFICLLGGSWRLFSTFTPKTEEKAAITPLFEIGDCIKVDIEPDEFNLRTPTILRIIEVGKKSYKYAYVEYTDYCLRDSSYCHVLNFTSQDNYVKTSCNN